MLEGFIKAALLKFYNVEKQKVTGRMWLVRHSRLTLAVLNQALNSLTSHKTYCL